MPPHHRGNVGGNRRGRTVSVRKPVPHTPAAVGRAAPVFRPEIPAACGGGHQRPGYGWCMWFALDPVLGREPWSKLSAAAKGLYDQELMPRTGYYKKTGAGRYDPTRYEE